MEAHRAFEISYPPFSSERIYRADNALIMPLKNIQFRFYCRRFKLLVGKLVPEDLIYRQQKTYLSSLKIYV
jgi:hypothetical protein